MSITFEVVHNNLILCYAPEYGIDDFEKRLINGEELHIRNTFIVNQNLLLKSDENDLEESLRFCVGNVGKSYIQMDSAVLGTEHIFYFSSEIKLKPELFVAYRNISILRKIDQLIERDFYIGGSWEEYNGISKETYDYLVARFPKTAELDKYAHMRIANILKDYFPECDKYEEIYKKYVESRKRFSISNNVSPSEYNLRIELEQFSLALKDLINSLNQYETIDEKEWQEKIQNIILILYPKYIHYAREIRFHGIDKHDKQPDFLLVDANGFIDIMEIKKADVLLLTKYRNNYVASRELSGAIQQIEKYIYCLNTTDKAKDDVTKQLCASLPEGVSPLVVNPQGILILGRSNDFNDQQKKDFELIKRQYKHIADIMTYDELAQRLKNIVASLKNRL